MDSNFASGLATGILSGFIFNPIDRAIYLTTTKGHKITDVSIWKNAYQGLSLNLSSRLITSGMYFFYLDYFSSTLESKFQVSLITAIGCAVINPVHIVKFNSWYHNYSYLDSYRTIKRSFGYKGFMIGTCPLIIRDTLFNYIYVNFKNDSSVNNLLTISGALVAVSPFNLIKNKKYASNESIKSIIANFNVRQLGLSLSIVRNVVSFYATQVIYDNIKKLF